MIWVGGQSGGGTKTSPLPLVGKKVNGIRLSLKAHFNKNREKREILRCLSFFLSSFLYLPRFFSKQQSPLMAHTPPAIDHPTAPTNNVKGSNPKLNQTKLSIKLKKRYALLSTVKVYYTFKGNATTCLCTFETFIKSIKSEKYIDIPLKRCLLAVCSSW